MKTHCGEVNAVFNKRFSSFALYEGKDGKDFLPFQVSSKFCPRDLDKKFIEGLRKWLVDFQLDEGIFKNKYIDIISNEFIPHIYTFHPDVKLQTMHLLCRVEQLPIFERDQ